MQGYVPYGQAIVFIQSTPTYIQISSTFNLAPNTSFTIEGFFFPTKTLMNAVLLQLTQQIRITMTNGLLGMSFGSDIYLNGTSILSTDEWHHFGFTYDAEQRQMTIYIDGEMDSTKVTSQPSASIYNQTDSPVLIGVGYRGYIDQLSISLKVKSAQIIQWDATTAAYYPMDLQWLEDKGPNGLNATAARLRPIYGWMKNALNFNRTGGSFSSRWNDRLRKCTKIFHNQFMGAI